MSKFEVVSMRSVNSRTWPARDEPAIKQARKLYDEGKIGLITRKENGMFILLKWTHDHPVKRKPYFSVRPV